MLLRYAFAVLLLGLSAASYSGVASRNDSTATLSRTLATLNLSDPFADLELNLKRGDHRFIGINGYTCMAPGIADTEYQLLRRFGLRWEKASAYAREYNLELYRRIKKGLVP